MNGPAPEIASQTQPIRLPFWKRKAFRFLILFLMLALSGAIVFFGKEFAQLAAIGYPGIFLVSLLGNATIVLPAPSLALVFAMGSVLNPVLVGLVAGAGEALGELTGYAAGYGGQAVIEHRERYDRLTEWMARRGGITIFFLSLIPNPFVDLAGIAAGSLRYPLLRFLFFCWMGKTVKTLVVAWAGANSLNMIRPFLG